MVSPVRRRRVGFVLAALIPVIFWLGILLPRPKPVPPTVQPVVPKARPKLPARVALPSYIVPFGPRNVSLFPELVTLQGETVEQRRQATGAVWGLPPVYYDLVSGRIIGFASIGGRPLDYMPMDAGLMAEKRRVLVLIRRQPKRFAHNIWRVEPDVLLKTTYLGKGWKWRRVRGKRKRVWGDCYADVNLAVVKRLGIDVTKFDVVVMHHNDCVYPNERHERSAMIATSKSIRVMSWSVRKGTRATVFACAGPGVDILFGDGGETIQPPKPGRAVRKPPIGLFFYRFKKGEGS